MSPMLAAVLLMASSCAPNDAPPSIDLIQELPSAERRAAGNVEDAVRAQTLTANGTDTVLLMRAPARVTWTLRFPDAAALTTAASIVPGADGSTGAGATLRIGLSDDRYYEGIFKREFAPDAVWQPIVVDLSKYAGWQWSLFYRPSERRWKLIVNADATPGATLALRAPLIRRH